MNNVRTLKNYATEIETDLAILHDIKIQAKYYNLNESSHYKILLDMMNKRLLQLNILLENPKLTYRSIPIKSKLTFKNTKSWN